jgi:hypothetical protein
MSTQEIPRDEWRTFFDGFSRDHEGWIATLEVFGADVGAQEEAHELSFGGISFNSEAGESEAVVINVGKSAADHVSHTIDHPQHVWLQQSKEGTDSSLEIEAQDDSKTLVRLRSL